MSLFRRLAVARRQAAGPQPDAHAESLDRLAEAATENHRLALDLERRVADLEGDIVDLVAIALEHEDGR